MAGLLLAVIFAAAMSSIDSEVSALAATSISDVYRPWLVRGAADAHYVLAARLATLGWGAVAAGFAFFAARRGSVIEAVNEVGSFFYGPLLGVFALGWGTRVANGHGAVAGLAAGVLAVAACAHGLDVAWLWLNPIGAAATVAVGLGVSLATRDGRPR
jgi:Na+/proline symporter